MKGKKIVALGLIAVMTGSMLAGCGGTSGGESGTEQTAKSDGGTVELELFSSKTDDRWIYGAESGHQDHAHLRVGCRNSFKNKTDQE